MYNNVKMFIFKKDFNLENIPKIKYKGTSVAIVSTKDVSSRMSGSHFSFNRLTTTSHVSGQSDANG